MAVKVKKLQWNWDGQIWEGVAGEEKRYVRIGWRKDAPYEFGGEAYATLEEAQSIAQDHLERRIISAIENDEEG